MSARNTIERREGAIQTRNRPRPGVGFQAQAEKGLSTGYAALDDTGKVPTAQLPAVGTAEITDDAVTFPKLQNISTNTVIGRATAGTGDAEELTCTAAGRTLLDDATAGDQRTTLGLGALATKSSIATGDIDNDAVTYAKLQNVTAPDKLLGRSSGGAGDTEEIACTAAGRTLLDDASASDQRTTLGLGTAALEAYSTGSWTPVDGSGAGLALTVTDCTYIKFGKLVFASFNVLYPATADGSGAEWGGLPFNSKNIASLRDGGYLSYTDANVVFIVAVDENSDDVRFYKHSGARVTNTELSGKSLRGMIIYEAA